MAHAVGPRTVREQTAGGRESALDSGFTVEPEKIRAMPGKRSLYLWM